MPSPEDFDYPRLNASLNAIAFIFLVAGWLLIRSDRKKAHVVCMISALITSTLFLVSYVTYHSLTAGVVTKFPEAYPVARKVYLVILFSHIPLAALLVPLVVMTVIPAIRARFDKHKRFARVTLPIWVYVSVTGVIIYLMLYRWFVPVEASAGSESATESVPPAAVSDAPDAAVSAGLPSQPADAESAATSGGTAGAARAGVLSGTPPVFDLHAKPEDEVVTARFDVTNHSDAEVRIVHMDTSCACLEIRSNADAIGAGRTVVVEADFILEKLVGDTEKYVTLRTDDPARSELHLGVHITVDPVFSIEPLTLDWKVGEAAEPKEIVFKVLRDKPVHITSVESSRTATFPVALHTVEAGREYRIVLSPESTEKELLGFLRIKTDCEIPKYAHELAYFKVSGPNE